MKKYLLYSLLILTTGAYAQKAPGLLNEKVRYGKLDNGFTYYIMHNEEPKDRASFYIAHNVGAILEEDHQDGLAHMLEHMAFNGSANFPGKGVKNFLERNGVEFGRNINAYTNLDETVYNISNVPTADPVVMDSCVWILHDWSNSITLAEEEIDAERGVIKEEWRTRNNAGRRFYKQLAPINYYNSQYAKRDVIGSMDVVENSDPEAMRSFYQKWYRPDLQAAIIVGDIDVDAMEKRVIEILSKIPKPVNPAERIEYPVGENEGILFGFATDKEANTTQFNYTFKHPVTPREQKNREYLKDQIKKRLVSSMLSSRFQEILTKPDAPFLNAYAAYYNSIRTQDIFAIGGTIRENESLTTIEAVLTEIERARRHGFLDSELERVKSNMLTGYESQYKTREKISNDRHAMQLKDHFMTNDPQPGIEFLYEFANKYVPTVTVDDLKPYLGQWMTKDNAVFTLTGPEKEGVSYPTENEVREVLRKVEKLDIAPYEDSAAGLTLLEELPEAGKVVKTEKLKGLDEATKVVLSNGATVILYPTDFTKSQVSFRAVSPGGESLLKTELLPTAMHFSSFVDRSGIGQHSESDLRKVMAGKNARLNVGLNNYTENMSGSADIDDIEDLMKLVYMTFTQPRFDEEAFNVYLNRMKPYYENMTTNPSNAFRDTVNMVLTNRSERRPINNIEILDKLSFEDFQTIYKDRFSNAGDFTFFFVGDFKVEELLPHITQYIGGIQGNGVKEQWKDDGVQPPAGDESKYFKYAMETPKQTNLVRYYSDDYDYNVKNNLTMSITASLLRKRYFERMREEEGGTYGAGVGSITVKIPNESMGLNVSFDSNPEKGEKLLDIVREEVDQLVAKGAIEEDFAMVKETMLKEREQSLKNNGYIMGQLQEYHLSGINWLSSENYEKVIENLTVEEYNKNVRKLLGNKDVRRYEIVMQPQPIVK